MAVVDTNWKTFLSPDSTLPPDVTFLVKGGDEGDKRIRAHRFLLAGTSPVFNRQFLGPMKDTSEVVEVEGTTPEAFTSMINYIYRLPEEGTFNLATCPQMLFDLLNLAEKYEILPLKIITSQALEALDISRQNLIFSATVATKYKNTGFGDLSQKLLLKCLEFLFRMTKGTGDILALIMETKKTFPDLSLDIFHDLISVGKDVLQVPGIYSNFGNSI